MATFTQNAIGILRSAETALAGKGYGGGGAASDKYDERNTFMAVAQPEQLDGTAALLLSQLRLALSEIAELRAEMTAEKEARSQSVLALGRRWKEDVVAEMRAEQFRLCRDFAELENRLGSQFKDGEQQRAVMRAQLDEISRAVKVRDGTQFEERERLHDELDELRRKVDVAVVQSASSRVECVQQLEKERESLSQRLDVELLRYVDMRREDQRETQRTRESVREEINKVNDGVKEMVAETWRGCAAALEKTLREPVDALQAEVTQAKASARQMREVVEDCVRTCQGEARMQTVTLKERIASLESNEAATQARMDRAEKKADAAYDSATRTDTAVTMARESVDKALVKVQYASDRAQRVEDVLTDRDARLTQLESHMQLVSTAEKLRADIESCRRSTGRVEAQVDALRVVCERGETLSERTSRQVEAAVERVLQCEKTAAKSHQSAEAAVAGVGACVARMAAVEAAKDQLNSITERAELAAARVEQRVEACENRAQLLTTKMDQSIRDSSVWQLSVSTRVEAAHELSARCESVSAAARAEVDRLEKRLLRLEAATITFTGECGAIRTELADYGKEMQTLSRQHHQSKEWQEAREARLDERLAHVDNLEAAVVDRIAKQEQRVSAQLSSFGQRSAAQMEQLETSMEELATRLSGREVERRVHQQLVEVQRHCSAMVAKETGSWQPRIDALEDNLSQLRSATGQLAPLNELAQVRRAVSTLDAQLRAQSADVQQQVAAQQDSTEAERNRRLSLEKEQARCGTAMRAFQDELARVAESVREREHRMQASIQAWMVEIMSGLDAAMHQQREQNERAKMAFSAAAAAAPTGPGTLSPAQRTTSATTGSTMMASGDYNSSSPSVHLLIERKETSAPQQLQRAPPPPPHDSPEAHRPVSKSQDSCMTPSQLHKSGSTPPDTSESKSLISSVSSVHGTTNYGQVPSGGTATMLMDDLSGLSSGLRNEGSPRTGPLGGAAVTHTQYQQRPPMPTATTTTTRVVGVPQASLQHAVDTNGGALNVSVASSGGVRTAIQRFTPVDDTSTDETTERIIGASAAGAGVRSGEEEEERTEDTSLDPGTRSSDVCDVGSVRRRMLRDPLSDRDTSVAAGTGADTADALETTMEDARSVQVPPQHAAADDNEGAVGGRHGEPIRRPQAQAESTWLDTTSSSENDGDAATMDASHAKSTEAGTAGSLTMEEPQHEQYQQHTTTETPAPQHMGAAYDDWDSSEEDQEQMADAADMLGSDDDDDDDTVIPMTRDAAVVAEALQTADEGYVTTGRDDVSGIGGSDGGAALLTADRTPVRSSGAAQSSWPPGQQQVSPSPMRPSAMAAAALSPENLKATPRKTFVADEEDDPLKDVSVPTHGKSTTSSSAGGSANSAARSSAEQEPGAPVSDAAKPTSGKYTSFDDSDSD